MQKIIITAAFAFISLTACAQNSGQKSDNDSKGKCEKMDPADMFAKDDANSDGYIVKSEAKGPLADNFSDFDTNSDGKISESEFTTGFEKNKPEGKGDKGKGGKMDKRGGGDKPDPAEFFSKADANSDGYIVKSEAKGPFADNFDELDTNSDGKISETEFTSGMENLKGQKPPRNEKSEELDE